MSVSRDFIDCYSRTRGLVPSCPAPWPLSMRTRGTAGEAAPPTQCGAITLAFGFRGSHGASQSAVSFGQALVLLRLAVREPVPEPELCKDGPTAAMARRVLPWKLVHQHLMRVSRAARLFAALNRQVSCRRATRSAPASHYKLSALPLRPLLVTFRGDGTRPRPIGIAPSQSKPLVRPRQPNRGRHPPPRVGWSPAAKVPTTGRRPLAGLPKGVQ